MDAFFAPVSGSQTEHHQVKRYELDPSEVKKLVKGFETNYAVALSEGRVRRFFLVSAMVAESIRRFFENLRRYRDSQLDPATDTALEARTRRDLVDRLSKVGLQDHADFIIDNVDLHQDWGGFEHARSPYPRLGAELGQVPEFQAFDVRDLTEVARRLVQELDDRKSVRWSRGEVVTFIRERAEEIRNPALGKNGQLLFLCQQSRASVRIHPEDEDLPERLRGRLHRRVFMDHVGAFNHGNWDQLESVTAELLRQGGELAKALREGETTEVVYYGFPYIPFAALSGCMFGEQAAVHLLEHQRDTRRFAWPSVTVRSSPPPVFKIDQSRTDTGSQAVVRVSVSTLVRPEVSPSFDPAEIGAQVHFQLPAPARGAVVDHEHLLALGHQIRTTLDSFSGDPQFTDLHFLAAVPVSLAFLLGQICCSTGYPRCHFYNFRLTDAPAYKWRLQVNGSPSSGQGAVHVL